MFRKILVPIDLDNCHDRTVREASTLAADHGAELHLVHVVELLAGDPAPELDSFYKKLEAKSRQHLKHLWKEVGDPGLAHEERVLFGSRVPTVLELAEKEKFDLIVLSSHRIDPEKPPAASISHVIAGLAPCDVLLVKASMSGE